MLEHPERPEAVSRGGRRGREWSVYLVIALAAGVVAALGVPWWLAVPVALALELVSLVALQRRGLHRPARDEVGAAP